jgi:dimethylamine monooxygenase subunit A
MVTTQADWSLDFDVGMSFHEWHAPVPMAHNLGVFDRALKFLLKLQHGAPVRRFNWTMTVDPLLDTSPENYPKWGPTKATLDKDNIGRRQHLRVELQTLHRLPRSNAIAFPIRCYLISFQDLVTVPKWGRRLHRVIRDLPEPLAAYKGFLRNRPLMVEWLSQYDDGQQTSPGWWPE